MLAVVMQRRRERTVKVWKRIRRKGFNVVV